MSLQNGISHNGNGNGHNSAVPGTNSTGVVITHSETPLPEGVHLPLYMDNHATTPLDPRVLEAMMPYFTGKFGNAASRNHQFGWEAEKAVDIAREQIAKLIGATAKEIIFTSGATECDNLAIKGIAEMYRERGNHIITQVTEHKAVLDTCKKLEKMGYRVTYLPVQADGLIDLDDLRRAIVTEVPRRPSWSPSCTPTTRSASSSPSARSASSVTRRVFCSTPTPFRRSARSPSTCRPITSTSLASRRTRLTGRRVLARSMFAAATRACRSPSRSTAEATSAACAAAPSTSRHRRHGCSLRDRTERDGRRSRA